MASWKYIIGFANSFALVFLLFIIVFFLAPPIICNCHPLTGGIASAEAERLARQIDYIISFKGVSNSETIYLSRELRVGNAIAPYSFEIIDKGVIIVKFENYPYKDIQGTAQFGLMMNSTGGADKIECTWDQIQKGASFTVTKESSNYYDDVEQAIYSKIKVTIDASASCSGQMVFEERIKGS